jgi:hypothetical protein
MGRRRDVLVGQPHEALDGVADDLLGQEPLGRPDVKCSTSVQLGASGTRSQLPRLRSIGVTLDAISLTFGCVRSTSAIRSSHTSSHIRPWVETYSSRFIHTWLTHHRPTPTSWKLWSSRRLAPRGMPSITSDVRTGT